MQEAFIESEIANEQFFNTMALESLNNSWKSEPSEEVLRFKTLKENQNSIFNQKVSGEERTGRKRVVSISGIELNEFELELIEP